MNSYTDYYTYIYLDENYIPFYVGKGRKSRYKIQDHLAGFNKLLINKINKIGIEKIKISLVKTNMSEQDAINCEKYWIKLIGRRDLGLGPLCNLTNGGEGMSGFCHSEETKMKLSILSKKTMASEEIRNKIRQKMTGRKRPIDVVLKMHDRRHSLSTKLKMSKIHKERMLNIKIHPWSGKRKESHQSKITQKLTGEQNGQSKLTTKQVLEIREQFNSCVSTKQLCSIYNVSRQQIQRIVKRLAWKHI